jgi:hypothetical protein
MFFKVIVVIIALVVLIIYLTIIGTQINWANKNSVFPPIRNPCPDNWEMDASGNCYIPSNTAYCGNTNCKFMNTNPKTHGIYPQEDRIDFSDPGWVEAGSSKECTQKKWANMLRINWDTIPHYNQCS